MSDFDKNENGKAEDGKPFESVASYTGPQHHLKGVITEEILCGYHRPQGEEASEYHDAQSVRDAIIHRESRKWLWCDRCARIATGMNNHELKAMRHQVHQRY